MALEGRDHAEHSAGGEAVVLGAAVAGIEAEIEAGEGLLAGFAGHPNVAAYVIVGLGCEVSYAQHLVEAQDLVTLGEKIYRGGIQNRSLPACAGCHSPNGAGIPAQYPRVSGQHADYTASQLVAFRDGIRKNSPQMSQIAAKLNDREIRAVADYVAGLR